jgi:hypothetical protein
MKLKMHPQSQIMKKKKKLLFNPLNQLNLLYLLFPYNLQFLLLLLVLNAHGVVNIKINGFLLVLIIAMDILH